MFITPGQGKNMRKKRIHFIIIATLSGLISLISAQAGLTPAMQTIQNDLIKYYETTGYGDYELDLVHKKIALLLPKLKDRIEKDSAGEERIKLEITTGESVHGNGDQYLVHGYAYLYPGAEEGKLKKIVMEYIRTSANGATYKNEKRELINPTPDFLGENKVDSNNDIILTLSTAVNGKGEFKKIRETTFASIDRHDRKVKLLQAYKNYLRRTIQALELNITDIELAKVTELMYMLEFE